MTPLSPKVLKRIQNLWARMMDPSSDKESAAARTALLELLNKNGRTWHDLQKIMAEVELQRMAAEEAAAAATRAAGLYCSKSLRITNIPRSCLSQPNEKKPVTDAASNTADRTLP